MIRTVFACVLKPTSENREYNYKLAQIITIIIIVTNNNQYFRLGYVFVPLAVGPITLKRILCLSPDSQLPPNKYSTKGFSCF